MGGSSSIKYTDNYQKPSSNYCGEYKEQQYFVVNPWDEKPIIYSEKGPGSKKATTIMECLDKIVKAKPDAKIWAKEYRNYHGNLEWKYFTRKDAYRTTSKIARAFIKLGIKEWDTVCIMGFNSPRWVAAFLGSLYAGCIGCGLYSTNNAGQCEYIVNHCKCSFAFVEDKKQLEKFLKIRKNCKTLKYIIVYNDVVPENVNEDGVAKVLSWEKFYLYGESEKEIDNKINEIIKKRKPGQCCSLIYTSGTTGNPKGVMISHDNLIYLTNSLLYTARNVVDFYNMEHRSVSYLPLSHIAGQFLDIIVPILMPYGPKGECKSDGVIVHFARSDALKGSLKNTLCYVKPTIFFGVPRVWEKFEEGIKKVGKSKPKILRKISKWAKKIGTKNINAQKIDGSKKQPKRYKMANKIVFKKVKANLGLDKCLYHISGAAPISKTTLEYLGSLGIDIYQAYGASESTGVHTVGIPLHDKFLSVGISLDGNEVKINHVEGRDKQSEGEILLRGRNIMMGYLYDAEKSKSTIDNFGYYHTGDVGKVDENNLLSITGRIKELIITAGGENIAPIPIEDYIKAECEGISNCVLIGDQKKYLTMLITLKCKQNLETQEYTNELDGEAKEIDESCKTVEDAKKSDQWKEHIEKGIKKYNDDKEACVSRAQKIQYFRILNGDFSLPGGELTATLKLKRNVVADKYQSTINEMY